MPEELDKVLDYLRTLHDVLFQRGKLVQSSQLRDTIALLERLKVTGFSR